MQRDVSVPNGFSIVLNIKNARAHLGKVGKGHTCCGVQKVVPRFEDVVGNVSFGNDDRDTFVLHCMRRFELCEHRACRDVFARL